MYNQCYFQAKILWVQVLQAPCLEEFAVGQYLVASDDALSHDNHVAINTSHVLAKLNLHESIHPCLLLPHSSSNLSDLHIRLPETDAKVSLDFLQRLPEFCNLASLTFAGHCGETSSFLELFTCLCRYTCLMPFTFLASSVCIIKHANASLWINVRPNGFHRCAAAVP